jgi:hypothetical protein
MLVLMSGTCLDKEDQAIKPWLQNHWTEETLSQDLQTVVQWFDEGDK